jgi:hypothetical protein
MVTERKSGEAMNEKMHRMMSLLVLTAAVFGVVATAAVVIAPSASAERIFFGAGCDEDPDAEVGVLCHVHYLNP